MLEELIYNSYCSLTNNQQFFADNIQVYSTFKPPHESEACWC